VQRRWRPSSRLMAAGSSGMHTTAHVVLLQADGSGFFYSASIFRLCPPAYRRRGRHHRLLPSLSSSGFGASSPARPDATPSLPPRGNQLP
jgi:hypothetical protein